MASDQQSSYLQYLPAIFNEDPFLGDFLKAFEKLLTGREDRETEDVEPQQGLEEIIADLPRLFDPLQTREDFLEWLAGWTALSLRADWKPQQKREFLDNIIPLYRRRGTKQNLIDLLKIYTGLEPVIAEGEDTVFQIGKHSTLGADTQIAGPAPHYFRVTVTLPDPDLATLQRQTQIVTALIDLEKPAHTAYELEIIHDTMQIGIRSTLGVDTLLGSLPESSEGE